MVFLTLLDLRKTLDKAQHTTVMGIRDPIFYCQNLSGKTVTSNNIIHTIADVLILLKRSLTITFIDASDIANSII